MTKKKKSVCFVCRKEIDKEDKWLYATDRPYLNRFVHRWCRTVKPVHLDATWEGAYGSSKGSTDTEEE